METRYIYRWNQTDLIDYIGVPSSLPCGVRNFDVNSNAACSIIFSVKMKELPNGGSDPDDSVYFALDGAAQWHRVVLQH